MPPLVTCMTFFKTMAQVKKVATSMQTIAVVKIRIIMFFGTFVGALFTECMNMSNTHFSLQDTQNLAPIGVLDL